MVSILKRIILIMIIAVNKSIKIPKSIINGIPWVVKRAVENKPFSITKKPMICPIASLRVIINNNPIKIIAKLQVRGVMIPLAAIKGICETVKYTIAIRIHEIKDRIGIFR